MVVSHLFHVLGFVAMQPAPTLDARSIVEETGKVFRLVSDIDAAYEGSFGKHGLEPTSG